MHHLPDLLFFGIPILYYYISLNSSIICCLSCRDIYLSFGIPLLASFECNCFECNFVEDNSFEGFFEIFINLSAILLPIKSPAASAVF